MEFSRINKNLEELSSSIKDIISSNPQNVHFDIILQNLDILKGIFIGLQNFETDDQRNSLYTWFDICHWLCSLSFISEQASIWQAENAHGKLAKEIAFFSLAHAYILSRFIWFSTGTIPQCVWLKDSKFTYMIFETTKNLFLRVFSIIEIRVIDVYEEMVTNEQIGMATTELGKLVKLWEDFKSSFSGDQSKRKKFQNQMSKMMNTERPRFMQAIELLVKEKKNLRLKEWRFLTHMRNSITHGVHTSNVTIDITLAGRRFILKKGETLPDPFPDQFITFSIHLVGLYFDLLVANESDPIWLMIKEKCFGIKPEVCIQS